MWLLQFGLFRINLPTRLSKIFFIVVQFDGNHVVNFRWIINHKRKLKGSKKYKTYQNFQIEFHHIFSEGINKLILNRFGIANCYLVFNIVITFEKFNMKIYRHIHNTESTNHIKVEVSFV